MQHIFQISPGNHNPTFVWCRCPVQSCLLSNGELRSGEVSTLLGALIPAAKTTGKAARSISLLIKSSECLNGSPSSAANGGSQGDVEIARGGGMTEEEIHKVL